MQIEVKIDAADAQSAIARVLDFMRDPTRVREAVGELLLDSAQNRIMAGGPAPDGQPWEPLSPAYLLTKKGPGILRESNKLMNKLRWQPTEDGIVIGSDRPYAAIHQLGGVIKKKARDGTVRLRKVGGRTQFAKKSHKNARTLSVRFGEHTIHIPARPYLGVSEQDKADVVDVIGDLLQKALRG